MLRLLPALILLAVLTLAPLPAAAEKRLALVIGINAYDNMAESRQLKRAVNDARSVSAALTALGYDVITDENIGRARFNEQWQKLLDKIAPGDTVVFYFSGHGVEIEGGNFLLARDLPGIYYGRQEQLKREALSVQEFLLDLRQKKPRVSILILDACRDHPLIPPELKTATGSKGGLASMKDPPEGTFVMFAAGAGETALDRLPAGDADNVNSVYTRKLLPLLKQRGLELPDLARQLRSQVRTLAASVPHTQRPAYYDNLDGKFCFAGCEVEPQQVAAPSPSTPAPSPATSPNWWPWTDGTARDAGEAKAPSTGTSTPQAPGAPSDEETRRKLEEARAKIEAPPKPPPTAEPSRLSIPPSLFPPVAEQKLGWYAVVQSRPSSEAARAESMQLFAELQAKYPTILAKRTPGVLEADLGEKGKFLRTVVTAATREEATKICSDLRSAGYIGCWITDVGAALPKAAEPTQTGPTRISPSQAASPPGLALPSFPYRSILILGGELRKEAREESPSLRFVNAGERITLIGREGDWYFVLHETGNFGYVRKQAVSVPK